MSKRNSRTSADDESEERGPSIYRMVREWYAAHPQAATRRSDEDRAAARGATVKQLLAYIVVTVPRWIVAVLDRGVAETERKIGTVVHKAMTDALTKGSQEFVAKEQELKRSGKPIPKKVKREMAEQLAMELDDYLDEPAITPSGEELPARRLCTEAQWAVRNLVTFQRTAPDVERLFGESDIQRQVADYAKETGKPADTQTLIRAGVLNLVRVESAKSEGRRLLAARLHLINDGEEAAD